MANRPDDFDPTVTNVQPVEDQGTTLANAAGDVAAQAAQMSAAGKAVAATSQTQVQFRQLDSQFRLANADNPNDPAALSQLQSDRQAIVDQNGADVPGIAMKDYTNKTVELAAQSDDLNAGWATKQQMRNGVNGLQTARVTQLNNANQIGRDLATDPDADIGASLQYQQAMQMMHQGADPVIGADKTSAFLKDFQSDYAKSVIAGVAELNPQKAAQMLQDPAISQHFTTQDIGDMTQVIQKTQKQQALLQSLQTVKAQTDLSDVVNDPNQTYYEKRAAIDQSEMDGMTTTKAAAVARRVLTSRSDLDAQTDTPVMADIINKTYDLNANASTGADDYLVGVRDIQQQVLDMQASNQLTSQDARKLNKQISDLTSSKLATATNTAGMEFYDANQQFSVLPPEYRGQATRALFYATNGQQLTQQQMSNQASQVIDQINRTRRVAAQKSVQNLQQSDTQFLNSLDVTPDMIAHTAQKYGISQQEVITQLRANANAKARAKPAARAPAPDEDQQDIGSTKAATPPDPGIEIDGGETQ